MKRLVALVSAIPLLTFIGGWFTGRRKGSSHSVPTPVAHAVIPPTNFWERHKLLVDPYVLLVVTLISVLLSGTFAGLTWNVNRNQVDLMSRQLEVQAANSLPVFNAYLPSGEDYVTRFSLLGDEEWAVMLTDRESMAVPRIHIANDGGMARYATIDVISEIRVWISSGEERRILGPTAEAVGLYYLPPGNRNPGLGQEEWTFRSVSSFENMNDFFSLVSQMVDSANPNLIISFTMNIYFKVEYMDYQGVDREEYFVIYGGVWAYGPPSGSFSVELESDFQGDAYESFLRNRTEDDNRLVYRARSKTVDRSSAELFADSIVNWVPSQSNP